MVKEAQSHSEEDQKRRDETESRNRADTLIYTTEKTLQENRDKVGETEAKAVEEAIAAARKAVEEGGKDKIERAVQDLTKASHKLAETLYQKTQSPPPGGGDGAPSGEKKGDGGDVIDAEVVDKK
jgi:molecular chaperone DnaK